ncbi:Cna B-type domain-containing protein [Isobaculum melis]|uniref:LPXTG-motif cell wall anchor domain-containing protein n=1 Tax=Isobaculum melis TaxID=142588 RepID=A0A1H9TX74_9LACT|nr:Cna B-type domain-containing protein [Isobaculum melis]SES01642.1 LPXTG-motif cell wall anchor domain-containing protein [Isobaculum melis]
MIKIVNKITSFFLIFSLMLPLIIGGVISTARIVEAKELGKEGFIDVVKMEKTDLYTGERIGISVEFSEKEGMKIKDGDTITMSLPPELIGIVSSVELKDPETGNVFGQAKIVNDQVICTFNKTAEEFIHVKGYFRFNARVDSQTEGTISKATDFGVDIAPVDYTVTYEPNSGEVEEGSYPFFTKYGYMSEDGSNTVTWQMLINQPKKALANDGSVEKWVEVEDTSKDGQELLAGSFRYFIEDKNKNFTWLTPEEFNNYGVLEINQDNPNSFKLKVRAKEVSEKKFGVVYETQITDLSKKEYGNDYTIDYQVTGEEEILEKGTASAENNSASGGGSGDLPEKGSVRIVKTLENNPNVLLKGITFELFTQANQSLGTYQTDEQGQINVPNLALGQYYFKEIAAPSHFSIDKDKTYPFEIKASSETGVLINVTNSIEKTSLNLKKVWVGPETEQVTAKIYADGQDIHRQVIISKEYGWELTVTNLDKYHLDGSLIHYTVEEVAVPEHYESVISGDAEKGFTITNTNQEKVSFPVTKKWAGDATSSVTVYLKKNSKVTNQSIQLSAQNNWTAIFNDLPKYDEEGQEISYSIVEADMADYVATYSGNMKTGFILTNTRAASITIPVVKKWIGPVGEPVTIELLSDGMPTGRKIKLDAGKNWESKFTNLPQYNQNGQEIKYTVSEEKQENYDVQITGNATEDFTVINTNNETIEIPIDKEWSGPVGEKAIINLFANQKRTPYSLTLTKNQNWKGSFKTLPKYDEKGKEITYTIKEEELAEYIPSIQGNQKTGFTIINLNTEEVNIPVKKKWQGETGGPVKIYATANGVLLPDVFVILSEENNWEGTLEHLFKYEVNGTLIDYSVVEEELDGYVAAYSGDSKTGFTVTNTREDSITIPITKKWVGPKGEEVTIKLLANGQESGEELVLRADLQWQGKFTNMPKYDAQGQKILYTVKESILPNYETQITGNADTGFMITNINREEINIPVTKVWNGPKKNAVKVLLYNNENMKVEELIVDETTNWQGTFKHLPKYDSEGQEKRYFIREEAIDNYRPSITGNQKDGFMITNTNTETTSVAVTKEWIGPVAGRVQVNLMRDGKMTNKFTFLDKGNDWHTTFSDLEKYREDGTEYQYTVVEATTYENYETTISGDAQAGFILTNTNNEKITLPVKKEWIGPIGQEVTIELLQNGKKIVHQLNLNQSNDWQGVFTNLPKYDDAGNEYVYEIKEVPIEGYQSIITGDAKQGWIVTNKNIEKMAITVMKKWMGQTEDEAIFYLVKNGEKTDKMLTLNEMNHWQSAFMGLPKYDEKGQKNVYTVMEKEISGYQLELIGDADKGFVAINHHLSSDEDKPTNPMIPEEDIIHEIVENHPQEIKTIADKEKPSPLPLTGSKNEGYQVIGLLLLFSGLMFYSLNRKKI